MSKGELAKRRAAATEKMTRECLSGVIHDIQSFREHLNVREVSAGSTVEATVQHLVGVENKDKRTALATLGMAELVARDGLEALEKSDVEAAAFHVMCASRMVGIAAGCVIGFRTSESVTAAKLALSDLSKKGLNRRHSENRALKLEVYAWCDQHMGSFRNMDEAAWEVANKVVPWKFRTVRKHMTDWNKLRAAGKQ